MKTETPTEKEKEKAMKKLAAAIIISLAFVFAFSANGFADTGKTISDIKSLAGTWRGNPYSPVTNQRINITVTIYIKDDGTYKAYSNTLIVGQLSVLKDGKVHFESSRSSGTVTFYEDKDGNQTIKFWFDDGHIAGEYERVK